MKRRPNGINVKRRLTLAMRKHYARLAKERQGPDGKWESNAKKRMVRRVKKSCTKLGTAFEAMKVQRELDEQASCEAVPELAAALKKVSRVKDLRTVLKRLEALVVTPRVREQTPSIAEALLAAAKRCRKSLDEAVIQMLQRWVGVDEEDGEWQSTGAATASQGSAEGQAAITSSQCAPSSSSTARPIKPKRDWKLGSLFSVMREKGAEEEAAAQKALPGLVARLKTVRDTKGLRGLLPELGNLWASAKVIQQTPSVIDELVAAAKRCRKSKEPAVVELLGRWRAKLHEAEQAAAEAAAKSQEKPCAEVAQPAAEEEPDVILVSEAKAPTPCRSQRERPSQKLDMMFSKLRQKQDEEDAAAAEAAEALTEELAAVSEAAMLRSVLPKLEAWPASARFLRQSPNLLPAFEKAAKRCKKSKDEAVATLLSSWRDYLKAESASSAPVGDAQSKRRRLSDEAPATPTAATKTPLSLTPEAVAEKTGTSGAQSSGK
eukprot:TRINITY_DN25593_c0_g1_i1.p1 TRINITY_DN25593_c0_g1~~TRINITY_DN25593_c0_g1_i1.p1  ORF type:complete len:491 (-),score=149.88 TRINITY_DN25593_c0_g1_i1:77-1549(-)